MLAFESVSRTFVARRALVGALCVLALAACVSKPPMEKPVRPAATAPGTAGDKKVSGHDLPASNNDPSVITVAAVGDMMIGTDYPKNILPDDDGVGFFKDVAPILSTADVTFGNLEGTLLDGGDPVKVCKVPENCFLFRTPTRYAQYYKAAGFDVVSLANNHACDFGEPGRESSMKTLDAVGILHSGRAGDVARWNVKGRRFALIAFAPNVGAHQLNELEAAKDLVKQLATENDVVIVSFHGGAEGDGAEHLTFAHELFHEEDRGNVVEFARAMIDSGADLVFGHGPHVARAMELYHDRLIAYSLGNFATYYGIGVVGNRGIAPILMTRIGGDGRFVSAKIIPTVQNRPAGPSVDPEKRVLTLIRGLTQEAFPNGELAFTDNGEVTHRAVAKSDASTATLPTAPPAPAARAKSPATGGT